MPSGACHVPLNRYENGFHIGAVGAAGVAVVIVGSRVRQSILLLGNASGWMKRAGSVGFHVPLSCCHCRWIAAIAWKLCDRFLVTVICSAW